MDKIMKQRIIDNIISEDLHTAKKSIHAVLGENVIKQVNSMKTDVMVSILGKKKIENA